MTGFVPRLTRKTELALRCRSATQIADLRLMEFNQEEGCLLRSMVLLKRFEQAKLAHREFGRPCFSCWEITVLDLRLEEHTIAIGQNQAQFKLRPDFPAQRAPPLPNEVTQLSAGRVLCDIQTKGRNPCNSDIVAES